MHQLSDKKILIVLHADGIGGAENQSLLYGEHLMKAFGCKIAVWNFLEGSSYLKERVRGSGFLYREQVYPASKNMIKQGIKLAFLHYMVLISRADIILPYTLIPNVYMNLASHSWFSGTITLWNQRDEGIMHFEYNPDLLSKAISKADAIVSNSMGGTAYLKSLGADMFRCHMVRNGVPIIYFNDPQASPVTSRHDKYDHVCCMIANLHSNKDHDTLINAWKVVTDHFARKSEKCLLMLAGGQMNTTKKIEQLIKDLNLGGQVRLEGFVHDVPQLISNADLIIHCSSSEGTSNSVIEAMAGGKAVVATDIESIAHTLHESNHDFLYTDGDIQGLASRIIKLLEDPGLAGRIGADNYRKALANYSLDHYFSSMDSIIAGVLDERKHG